MADSNIRDNASDGEPAVCPCPWPCPRWCLDLLFGEEPAGPEPRQLQQLLAPQPGSRTRPHWGRGLPLGPEGRIRITDMDVQVDQTERAYNEKANGGSVVVAKRDLLPFGSPRCQNNLCTLAGDGSEVLLTEAKRKKIRQAQKIWHPTRTWFSLWEQKDSNLVPANYFRDLHVLDEYIRPYNPFRAEVFIHTQASHSQRQGFRYQTPDMDYGEKWGGERKDYDLWFVFCNRYSGDVQLGYQLPFCHFWVPKKKEAWRLEQRRTLLEEETAENEGWRLDLPVATNRMLERTFLDARNQIRTTTVNTVRQQRIATYLQLSPAERQRIRAAETHEIMRWLMDWAEIAIDREAEAEDLRQVEAMRAELRKRQNERNAQRQRSQAVFNGRVNKIRQEVQARRSVLQAPPARPTQRPSGTNVDFHVQASAQAELQALTEQKAESDAKRAESQQEVERRLQEVKEEITRRKREQNDNAELKRKISQQQASELEQDVQGDSVMQGIEAEEDEHEQDLNHDILHDELAQGDTGSEHSNEALSMKDQGLQRQKEQYERRMDEIVARVQYERKQRQLQQQQSRPAPMEGLTAVPTGAVTQRSGRQPPTGPSGQENPFSRLRRPGAMPQGLSDQGGSGRLLRSALAGLNTQSRPPIPPQNRFARSEYFPPTGSSHPAPSGQQLNPFLQPPPPAGPSRSRPGCRISVRNQGSRISPSARTGPNPQGGRRSRAPMQNQAPRARPTGNRQQPPQCERRGLRSQGPPPALTDLVSLDESRRLRQGRQANQNNSGPSQPRPRRPNRKRNGNQDHMIGMALDNNPLHPDVFRNLEKVGNSFGSTLWPKCPPNPNADIEPVVPQRRQSSSSSSTRSYNTAFLCQDWEDELAQISPPSRQLLREEWRAQRRREIDDEACYNVEFAASVISRKRPRPEDSLDDNPRRARVPRSTSSSLSQISPSKKVSFGKDSSAKFTKTDPPSGVRRANAFSPAHQPLRCPSVARRASALSNTVEAGRGFTSRTSSVSSYHTTPKKPISISSSSKSSDELLDALGTSDPFSLSYSSFSSPSPSSSSSDSFHYSDSGSNSSSSSSSGSSSFPKDSDAHPANGCAKDPSPLPEYSSDDNEGGPTAGTQGSPPDHSSGEQVSDADSDGLLEIGEIVDSAIAQVEARINQRAQALKVAQVAKKDSKTAKSKTKTGTPSLKTNASASKLKVKPTATPARTARTAVMPIQPTRRSNRLANKTPCFPNGLPQTPKRKNTATPKTQGSKVLRTPMAPKKRKPKKENKKSSSGKKAGSLVTLSRIEKAPRFKKANVRDRVSKLRSKAVPMSFARRLSAACKDDVMVLMKDGDI